jgi:hypothetical protein
MLACWKTLQYVSPLRGSGFPRKPIPGVGTPGYCMPRLQRSGPRPPPSLLSAASQSEFSQCHALYKTNLQEWQIGFHLEG